MWALSQAVYASSAIWHHAGAGRGRIGVTWRCRLPLGVVNCRRVEARTKSPLDKNTRSKKLNFSNIRSNNRFRQGSWSILGWTVRVCEGETRFMTTAITKTTKWKPHQKKPKSSLRCCGGLWNHVVHVSRMRIIHRTINSDDVVPKHYFCSWLGFTTAS